MPTIFKTTVAGESQLPCLVFGPDLVKNLGTIEKSPEFVSEIPEKLDANSTSNANSSNGIKFWNISTKKLTRNLSKSGVTEIKPIVAWINGAPKNNDIPDNVDKNQIAIVGNDDELVALACYVAKGFPKFNFKKVSEEEVREISVIFLSTAKDSSFNVERTINLMDNVREAARLVDTPPNILNTPAFEDEARKVVADLNNPKVSIEVFDSEELKARGHGLHHSVGQASLSGQQSKLVILKLENGDNLKNVAMVGKGIVYDTGGLSIKGKTFMPGMKIDMGGAAGLLFAFKQLVQSGFNQNLYCLLCLAENSVGPAATRPDDIVKGYSGLTVEINNTDAEGRLVLADGVHYATKDLKADICLNMCTLTGAQGVTTGQLHASILTNTGDYEDKLVNAGLASGDHCYPIIYAPHILMNEFKSECADMMNSVMGRSNAQCSCAGHFIEQHLLDGVDYKGVWIHVDMASPCFSPYDKRRTSGYGPALLNNLFNEYCG